MGNATTTLRALEASVLHPGLKLPGHIYNKRGRVLKRAGSVLTEEHVALLCDQSLMVDDGWDLPGSDRIANPVIEKLVDDIESKKMGVDRRRYLRHRWEASLCVKIEERADGEPVARELLVQSSDLSRAGFSFKFNRPIVNGSVVHVRFDDIPRAPKVTGVVRNSVRLDGDTYRVGVEFVSSSRSE